MSSDGQPRAPAGDEGPTQGLAIAAARAAAPDLPPGATFGQYRIEAFLGEGGMGRVYRARDTTLERTVALKFLRSEDPALRARLLREARSQARIDHEHVCPLYEVGEAGDRLYVAMRLIHGEPLDRAAAGLPLEARVLLMEQVAEGVHAAHRAGLVHRDLKPSNVLVEPTPDGGFTAFVLDFGLAREAADPALTVAGTILGTPHYMAPEQIRGETLAVDRRSDVYGLGATFYHVLCGAPPFDAPTTVETLRRALDDEPEPLSKRRPGLPRDLETIVMKCLEKAPERRYDSARSLAEDLRRYREGEPIGAARPSLVYRLGKRARKHRALLATVGVAALLVLTAAGVALQSRLDADRQARLAHELGREIEQAESRLRFAHLLPLHDLGPEREQLRQHVASIERQMAALGRLGAGPGHYALGRAYLALGELESARSHLERARAAGQAGPEVALALGVTLGRLYEEGRRGVERIRNAELREARRRELVRELRDPALRALAQGRTAATESPEYAEALAAAQEERWDDALRAARAAAARQPWLYEARLLEGDVLAARGVRARNGGDAHGAALAFAAAETAYRAAAAIGQSDPQTHRSLTRLAADVLHLRLYMTSEDLAPELEKAVASARQALTADPQDAATYLALAEAWRLRGLELKRRGRDMSEVVREELAAAQRAAELRPSEEAFVALATAHDMRADLPGPDPREAWGQAQAFLRRALELNPNHYQAWFALGNAQLSQHMWESERGLPAQPTLAAATDSYRRAAALNDALSPVHANLGICLRTQAILEAQAGRDPRPAFRQSVAAYERAVQLNAELVPGWNNLGEVQGAIATWEVAHGLDPRASLERAVPPLQKAAGLNPRYAAAFANLGITYLGRAEYEWLAGRTPDEWLARARQDLGHALELNPEGAEAATALSGTHLVEARQALAQGRSPEPALAAAAATLAALLRREPTQAVAHERLADAEWLRARWLCAAGRDAGPAFERGSAHCRAALVGNPRSLQARLIGAGLSLVQAEAERTRGRAMEPALTRGREEVEQALRVAPDQAEALALRGALALQEARGRREGAVREAARAAERDLRRALEINRHLARDYAEWCRLAGVALP